MIVVRRLTNGGDFQKKQKTFDATLTNTDAPVSVHEIVERGIAWNLNFVTTFDASQLDFEGEFRKKIIKEMINTSEFTKK